MAWVDALKHMSSVWGKYKIPKKGTKEYDQVKNYQKTGAHIEGDEVPVAHHPKKRGRPAKVKEPEPPKEMKTTRKVVMGKDSMKITLKQRKVRKDKGTKRGPTLKRIAEESVKQGYVSKAVAFGRKERSDKGKKRGSRKPKEVKTEKSEEMFYYQ